MNDSIENLRNKLSFDVEQHPTVDDDKPLSASVKVNVELGVRQDLQRGNELVVIIQTADGEVLGHGLASVCGVGFTDIVEKGFVIGTHRQHKAKLV